MEGAENASHGMTKPRGLCGRERQARPPVYLEILQQGSCETCRQTLERRQSRQSLHFAPHAGVDPIRARVFPGLHRPVGLARNKERPLAVVDQVVPLRHGHIVKSEESQKWVEISCVSSVWNNLSVQSALRGWIEESVAGDCRSTCVFSVALLGAYISREKQTRATT